MGLRSTAARACGLRRYDERTQSLGLCRDRFGEKPLYVYRDGDDLYFGSEVNFIASLLGRSLRVNHATCAATS